MRAFLKFDSDGRLIGRQSRTDDQLPEDTTVFGDEVPVESFYQYRDTKRWWKDGDKIKERTKRVLPKPLKRRLYSQPAIKWQKIKYVEGLPHEPNKVYNEGDQVSVDGMTYVAENMGISGEASSTPKWGAETVWEYMPYVVWNLVPHGTIGGTSTWKPLTIYLKGELIRYGDLIFRAKNSGITCKVKPKFNGLDVVEDRDTASIPIPDLKGHPVVMKIGGIRHGVTERPVITAGQPTTIAIELDSPGYYSDPYIVSVGSP